MNLRSGFGSICCCSNTSPIGEDSSEEEDEEEEEEEEGVGFCLSPLVPFWLTKLGLPPSFPASVRLCRISSSRIILRLHKAPVSSRTATPKLNIVSSDFRSRPCVKPNKRASTSSDIGRPDSNSLPRSSDSCMRQRISNQTPRSKKDIA